MKGGVVVSKAVLNFSENSSDLVALPVPNSKKGVSIHSSHPLLFAHKAYNHVLITLIFVYDVLTYWSFLTLFITAVQILKKKAHIHLFLGKRRFHFSLLTATDEIR